MKEHFFSAVVRHRKTIIITFFPATIPSLFLRQKVDVNYDINAYLPKESPPHRFSGYHEGGIRQGDRRLRQR